MRNLMHAILAVAALAVAAGPARAMDAKDCDPDGVDRGPCFGLEPTFTHGAMENDPNKGSQYQPEVLERWLTLAAAECEKDDFQRCRVEPLQSLGSAGKCVSPAGTPSAKVSAGMEFRVCLFAGTRKPWWYEVKTDENVIELGTRPANLGWLQALRDDKTFERIWQMANDAKVKPSRRGTGGCHLHIDMESGFSDVRHALDFMTTLHNLRFIPLARRVPAVHLMNAAPFSSLGPVIRHAYRDALQRHAANTSRDFAALADDLRKNVYTYHYASPPGMNPDVDEVFENRVKYHDVHLHPRYGTIEVRSIDAMLTPQDMVLVVEVFARAVERTRATKQAPLPLAGEAEIALEAADEDMQLPHLERVLFKIGGLVIPSFAKRMKNATGTDPERVVADFRAFVASDDDFGALVEYMPIELKQALRKK